MNSEWNFENILYKKYLEQKDNEYILTSWIRNLDFPDKNIYRCLNEIDNVEKKGEFSDFTFILIGKFIDLCMKDTLLVLTFEITEIINKKQFSSKINHLKNLFDRNIRVGKKFDLIMSTDDIATYGSNGINMFNYLEYGSEDSMTDFYNDDNINIYNYNSLYHTNIKGENVIHFIPKPDNIHKIEKYLSSSFIYTDNKKIYTFVQFENCKYPNSHYIKIIKTEHVIVYDNKSYNPIFQDLEYFYVDWDGSKIMIKINNISEINDGCIYRNSKTTAFYIITFT
jgi:hypothetical protein